MSGEMSLTRAEHDLGTIEVQRDDGRMSKTSDVEDELSVGGK